MFVPPQDAFFPSGCPILVEKLKATGGVTIAQLKGLLYSPRGVIALAIAFFATV